MTQLKKICAVIALAFATVPSFAGGILTNTNQSVAFLRNPAQEGAINLNGVYSNPAGVVFLGEGFHIGFNWQSVKQTREVTSTNPLFVLGAKNNGQQSKLFKGNATAPVLPSLQAAYNTGDWSFQFNFAVTGGGGKCTFDNGLGSFEGAIGGIAHQLGKFGANGQYDVNSYLQGKQYYFGFTLGAAYKFNEHLSAYLGARALYGTAAYKVNINNIKIGTANGMVDFSSFYDQTSAFVNGTLAQNQDNLDNWDALMAQINGGLAQVNAGLAQLQPLYDQYGENMPAEQLAMWNQLNATKNQLEGNQKSLNDLKALQEGKPTIDALAAYRDGVNLQCDQSGFGIAPIIGVDYKVGNFNFAAKYEFMTRMRLKNKSTVKEASLIGAVNKFQDGKSVPEDMPALLAVGAQWSVIPTVRLNAGYHLYFDKQSKKYGDAQEDLTGNTKEFLGGVEWDFTNKWTVSAGFQTTSYGLSDDYMNDMSFVVNSWTFGLGVKYQVNDKLALNAAYFQTNYDNYDCKKADSFGTTNDYTRTNKVVGLGVEYTF